MKKMLIPFALMSIAAVAFSQETITHRPVTRDEFMKKSKTQKTVGYILLGVGAGTIAIASTTDGSFETAEVLAIVAGASLLGSIPLFIASGRNKRKARAMAFLETEKNESVTINNKSTASYLAFGIKLTF